MVCSEMLFFAFSFFFFSLVHVPFLTDRLARVQLMESQGKATEVGGPHIA